MNGAEAAARPIPRSVSASRYNFPEVVREHGMSISAGKPLLADKNDLSSPVARTARGEERAGNVPDCAVLAEFCARRSAVAPVPVNARWPRGSRGSREPCASQALRLIWALHVGRCAARVDYARSRRLRGAMPKSPLARWEH